MNISSFHYSLFFSEKATSQITYQINVIQFTNGTFHSVEADYVYDVHVITRWRMVCLLRTLPVLFHRKMTILQFNIEMFSIITYVRRD